MIMQRPRGHCRVFTICDLRFTIHAHFRHPIHYEDALRPSLRVSLIEVNMRFRKFFSALILALFSLQTLNFSALADEGMWRFNHLPRAAQTLPRSKANQPKPRVCGLM